MSHIYATEKAFSALKIDGGVVAWGGDFLNNDQEKAVSESLAKLQEEGVVLMIARANYATAALKADGSVAAWGQKFQNADCTKVQTQQGRLR